MDIQQDISPEDEAFLAKGEQRPSTSSAEQPSPDKETTQEPVAPKEEETHKPREPKSRFSSLATPAVRGLLKEHNLNIEDISGTGKDGRVMKEDIHKHLFSQSTTPSPSSSSSATQTETPVPLTPIQTAMFKTMTASLSVPHFLYTDSYNLTSLTHLRRRLATSKNPNKLSNLPFIIKALSLALTKYPILNSKLSTSTSKPALTYLSSHNIGVAMDTPLGLLVPSIKNVQNLSISEIATQLTHLSTLAKDSKLSPADLSGGTITISNIGSIGGGVVAPVIVPGELAIIGVGKTRAVPVFGEDGEVERAEMCPFSWSADHRVVDGASVARASEVVRGYLEGVEGMVLDMR
jgi:2-oxoisovalerate dehydrogenase E2 component (dihydrolipoyl transacylase)